MNEHVKALALQILAIEDEIAGFVAPLSARQSALYRTLPGGERLRLKDVVNQMRKRKSFAAPAGVEPQQGALAEQIRALDKEIADTAPMLRHRKWALYKKEPMQKFSIQIEIGILKQERAGNKDARAEKLREIQEYLAGAKDGGNIGPVIATRARTHPESADG